MIAPPTFIGRNAQVWVTFRHRTTIATVIMLSENKHSAVLRFDTMLGGYLGVMPITWDGGTYRDLITNNEVTITPYPS